MARKHQLTTDQIHPSMWVAYDSDAGVTREATGKTEDLAVSNWWAIFSLDEKHPRKNDENYKAQYVLPPSGAEG